MSDNVDRIVGGRGRGRGRRLRSGVRSSQQSSTSSSADLVLAEVQAERQENGTLPVAEQAALGQSQDAAAPIRTMTADSPARKRRALRRSPECVSPPKLIIVHAEPERRDRPESQVELEPKREPESLTKSAARVDVYSDPSPGPSGVSNSGSGSAEEEVILEMQVNSKGFLTILDRKPVVSRRAVIGVVDDDIDPKDEECLSDIYIDDSEDEDLLNEQQTEDRHIELVQPLFESHGLDPADDDGLTFAQACIVHRDGEVNDRQVRELASSRDYFDFEWSTNKDTFTGVREVFTGTPGPTFPVTDSTKPTDIFYRMFDHDFIDMLVTETNRYAQQKLTKHGQDQPDKVHARILKWQPTNRDEMVTFLAVIILQGLYPKVKEENYFRYDGYGTTPYFRCIMTYGRYRLLKSLYHFVDNDTLMTGRTKLDKIRPVIDYFNEKFSSSYKPRQDICIDESLLKWQGRLSFSQRISSKAAQVGVKTYELCESSSGYLWNFFVYTGKDHIDTTRQDRTASGEASDRSNVQDRHSRPDDRKDDTEGHSQGRDLGSSNFRPSNATAKIVYDLVQPLLHQGHTLIMDNFYNSPLLARCLKRDGRTDVYGTLRLNREFVPESLKTLTKTYLQPGEIVMTYATDLALTVWRDANIVSMISTYHQLQIGGVERHDTTKFKPTIVLDYNKSMGGVDRKDQLLAAHPFERQRSKAWYKKLFLRLYNAALLNSYLIFTYHGRNISHRQFRTILAEDLLKIHSKVDLTMEPRFLPRPVPTQTTKKQNEPTAILAVSHQKKFTHAYVEHDHFPEPSGKRYARCWLCAQHKKVSRTAYKCRQCHVNLCLVNCFRNYHKLTTPVLGILPRVVPD